MKLEYLANELLLDLFGYLPAVDLLQAFYNLNLRLNDLVFLHFHSYNLHFRSISQSNFRLICREYLPTLTNHIRSLTLTNNDDTPQQIELLLEHGLTIRQFTQLKSLSLCDVCSNDIMKKMMHEWKHLPHLTHLTVAGSYLRFDPIDGQCFIDSIWSLPKLTYCYLNILFGEIDFFLPTVTSLSLKHLSIWGKEHHQKEINTLLKQTPCLEQLSVLLQFDDDDDDIVEHSMPLMTRLRITVASVEEEKFRKFLQRMPNLHSLTVNVYLDKVHSDVILTGDQWENIMRRSLPNLDVFRLNMEYRVIDEDNRDKHLDDLISSFRTSFWLKEHQWYVRCQWNPSNRSTLIYLYTLPYQSTDLKFDGVMQFESNCPDKNSYWNYNHVNELKCQISSLTTSIRCPNVNRLSVKFPVNDRLWSALFQLDRITTLNICKNNYYQHTLAQLQDLINHLPRLHSLSLDPWSIVLLLMGSFELVHTSIRRLDFRVNDQYFSDEQCPAFTRSSLGMQCEVLYIRIKYRETVLQLIKDMIHLRTLLIQCEDDKLNNANDENLLEWLRYRLPSTCIISRDPVFDQDIQIWIR